MPAAARLECASVLLKQVQRQLLSTDECRSLFADALQLPLRATSSCELACAALEQAIALTPENHGGSSVCVSQFLAQQLRQRLPATNPQVIPCGITLPTAQASFSDQPFRVVVSPQGGAPDVHQFNLLRVVDNQRSVAAGAAAADPSMQLS